VSALTLLLAASGPSLREVAAFGLLLAAAVILVVVLSRLLLKREPWDLEQSPEQFRALERAYERALRTIKDLEFDHQVGTLSSEEHARLRKEYKERAVNVRRALDRARQAAVRQIAEGKSAARLSEAERSRMEELVARARAAGKEPQAR
jgi:hypothetical protein